jgi:hypothetical protein
MKTLALILLAGLAAHSLHPSGPGAAFDRTGHPRATERPRGRSAPSARAECAPSAHSGRFVVSRTAWGYSVRELAPSVSYSQSVGLGGGAWSAAPAPMQRTASAVRESWGWPREGTALDRPSGR